MRFGNVMSSFPNDNRDQFKDLKNVWFQMGIFSENMCGAMGKATSVQICVFELSLVSYLSIFPVGSSQNLTMWYVSAIPT